MHANMASEYFTTSIIVIIVIGSSKRSPDAHPIQCSFYIITLTHIKNIFLNNHQKTLGNVYIIKEPFKCAPLHDHISEEVFIWKKIT